MIPDPEMSGVIPGNAGAPPLTPPSVVFLGLQSFGRVGGIQRFNQRLVRALLSAVGKDRLAAHFIRDLPADIPDDLREVSTAFGNGRLGYLFRSFTRALSADVLMIGHLNLLWIGGVVKTLRPRITLILMAHGVEVWNDPAIRPARWYEPRLLRCPDRIACVSTYTKSVMMREFGLDAGQFTTFPNTVDAKVDAQHTPTAPAFALAVSRMDPHDRSKHLDQIIRAMAELPSYLDHTRLVLVGDGPLKPDLQALAQSLGVADRVTFAGRVSDTELQRLYRDATLFVLPSSKEGFGIVYLEAWSHLLPVICSIHGAAPEVVTDGVDGFAIDPQDSPALARAMQRLFEDPALAAEMGQKGAEKLLQNYTTDRLQANVAQLIAQPEHG
ncbi:glycosyltransferase family 4 protein [Aliiroseovarius crassostreae]|uniref:glycosyltransferase family 4 protein n=1 Tax=Aliiroseovarius crassostreae TaxID=154981 RepID=UPI00223A9D71|nr:glycosyltransferase family 4 protein [Aliiroseovarius crassostreae]